jgi:hypothetical protein
VAARQKLDHSQKFGSIITFASQIIRNPFAQLCCRSLRFSYSCRAMFLIDARYVCGRESLTGGRVRAVGRHVGREPCLRVCAPRSLPNGLAVAVG